MGQGNNWGPSTLGDHRQGRNYWSTVLPSTGCHGTEICSNYCQNKCDMLLRKLSIAVSPAAGDEAILRWWKIWHAPILCKDCREDEALGIHTGWLNYLRLQDRALLWSSWWGPAFAETRICGGSRSWRDYWWPDSDTAVPVQIWVSLWLLWMSLQMHCDEMDWIEHTSEQMREQAVSPHWAAVPWTNVWSVILRINHSVKWNKISDSIGCILHWLALIKLSEQGPRRDRQLVKGKLVYARQLETTLLLNTYTHVVGLSNGKTE